MGKHGQPISLQPPVVTPYEYNIGQRCGPSPISLPSNVLQCILDDSANVCDFARLLVTESPVLGQEAQQTPGWAGVNALLNLGSVGQCVIGYLPVIPHPPTEMSTVHQLLQRSLAMK